MSRYRSEIDSLRRRERELRRRWRELDREQGVGRHAASRTGRLAYRAGRALGRLVRGWFRRDAEELARLRETIMDLERRIAEREREIEGEVEGQVEHPIDQARAPGDGQDDLEGSAGYRAGRSLRDAWDKIRD